MSIRRYWTYVGRITFWITWPGIFLCTIFTTRTRIIVTDQQQLLLVRGWLGNGSWQLPGGGLHRHEDPAVGAARELYEETGIHANPKGMKQLHERAKTKDSGLPFHYISFVYHASKTLAVPTKGLEILETCWVPLREIENGNYRLETSSMHAIRSWKNS